MAPEILMKKPKAVGPPLDIWGMGCILFAMTTGALPFLGNN
jgi:serine/threonine protein kinase